MALTMRPCFGVVLIAIGVGGGLAGCRQANPAVQRSQLTVSVLVDARQSLIAAEQAVAESQTAVRTLSQSKGDLQPPFTVFVAQSDVVRKQAERQRTQSDAVMTQITAYASARQSDIRTITNVELRQAAEERMARVQKQSETIKDLYARMNTSFNTYIRSLNDLQTYLANDLSYGALTPARRTLEEATSAGEHLRGDVRALAAEIDLLSNSLSTVPIAISQWPTTAPTTTIPATTTQSGRP